MPQPSAVVTQCPECRARFRVAAEHLGRRAKCPKCQAAFEVRAKAPGDSPPKTSAPEPQQPQLVGVDCRLCGTRLYGRLSQVGKPVVCPDCRTKTILPAPPPPRPPVVPAAMTGEQYEVWEGDDQPWGSRLKAAQPPTIPVPCEQCGALEYVPVERAGQQIECIECGYLNQVRAPTATPAPAGDSTSGDESGEYQLDDVPPEDDATPIYTHLHSYVEQSEDEREKQIRLVATDRRSRPQMPQWPLLTGWRSCFSDPGVVARWMTLSVLLAAAAGLATFAFTLVFQGYGALAGLPLLCAAAAAMALCFGAMAAMAIAIVTESSEGNDRVVTWPSANPIDWLGETAYVLIATLAAAAPGYLIGKAAGLEPQFVVVAMAASLWLAFPIVHLSTLEAGAPWALVAPGVAASLAARLDTWMLFYILSAAGGVAVVACLYALGSSGVLALLLVGPVLVVGGLGAYVRLLGRLAWRIRDEAPPPGREAPVRGGS